MRPRHPIITAEVLGRLIRFDPWFMCWRLADGGVFGLLPHYGIGVNACSFPRLKKIIEGPAMERDRKHLRFAMCN